MNTDSPWVLGRGPPIILGRVGGGGGGGGVLILEPSAGIPALGACQHYNSNNIKYFLGGLGKLTIRVLVGWLRGFIMYLWLRRPGIIEEMALTV